MSPIITVTQLSEFHIISSLYLADRTMLPLVKVIAGKQTLLRKILKTVHLEKAENLTTGSQAYVAT